MTSQLPNKTLHPFHKWWILIAGAACLSIGFFDMTSVSVSLPTIQRELHSSNLMLQWIVNAYLLALAIFIIVGGKLGDSYRHDKIFILGVSIFSLASFTSALAMNMPMLITSRFLQGVGAALYTPNITVLVFNAFPENERGKAIGLTVGSASVFLAFGPFIGGLITELLSWRLIFWLNIPLTLLSIFIIWQRHRHIAKTKEPKKPFDWRGFFYFALGISLLVISLMQSMASGWTSFNYILLFTSSVCWFLFYKTELSAAFPLIDFKIFQNKTFLACAIVWACLQMAIMTGVFRAIWFQNVLNYSPMVAGALALPSTLPILFMAPLAGKLTDKYGPKLLLTIGLSLGTLGLILIALAAPLENYGWMLPGLILLGFGLPLCTTPSSSTALKVTPKNIQGMSSATLSTVRQIGGTLGLAWVGAIITNFYNFHINAFFQTTPGLTHLNANSINGLLSGSAVAKQTIAFLPAASVTQLYHQAKYFYTQGFAYGNFAAALFLFIALLSVLVLLKKDSQK